MLTGRKAQTAHLSPETESQGDTASEAGQRTSKEESDGAPTQRQDNPNPEAQTSQNASPAGERDASEVESLQTKLAETHDRMLRIAAESDNARKRWEKERVEIRQYAITEFARELLPVIDAFDKAMTLIENTTINSDTEEGKSLAAIAEGVGMVSKVFHESIKKHGIERVPGKGEPFNPEYHNAIARDVDPDVRTDTVREEFVPGYRIGDRILRTAMVKVATPD